jgi:osmotically-inducible protein OsmY
MRRFAFRAAIGAAIAFFFDPTSGRRRRALARDRAGSFLRQGRRRLTRLQRHAQAEAYGVSQKAQHLREEPKPTPDDATLAQKVQTEIFRDPDVPKGQINVNAENGTVVLRGEVENADLIRDLEERVRKVQGVEEVENLLHVPGSTAPMHGRHGGQR